MNEFNVVRRQYSLLLAGLFLHGTLLTVAVAEQLERELSVMFIADFGAPVQGLLVDRNDEMLLVAYGSRYAAISRSDWKTAYQLDSGIPQINQMLFIGNNHGLLVVGGTPGQYGEAIIVSADRKIQRLPNFHSDSITSASLSPDGRSLATSSIDRKIVVRTMEVDAAPTVMEGHSKAVTGIAWIDDSQLISVGEDANLRVWNFRDRVQVRAMEQHLLPIVGLALLQKKGGELQRVVTIGEDKTARFWQPTIGRMIRFVKLEHVPVSIAFRADGTVRDSAIVIGDAGGNLNWVDSQTAEVTKRVHVVDDWLTSIVMTNDEREWVVGTNSGKLFHVR